MNYLDGLIGPDPIGADPQFALQSLARSLPVQVETLARLLGDALQQVPAVRNGALTSEQAAEMFLRVAISHYLVPHPEPDVLLANLQELRGPAPPLVDPRDRLSTIDRKERHGSSGEAHDAAGFEVTRFIPVPKSVSEQAQQFLGMGLSLGATSAAATRSHRHRGLAGDDQGQRRGADRLRRDDAGRFPHRRVEVLSVGDVPVYELMPDGVPDDPDGPIYFDIHGGALIMGGGDACRALATQDGRDDADAHVVGRLPHGARPPVSRRARRLHRGVPPAAGAPAARAHRRRRRIGGRQPRGRVDAPRA